MKKITLRSLTLRNFKKIESLTINFNDQTFIHGKNGIGKTTIADAYSWLLYGKNTSDQTDFNVKTLDKNNSPIHKLEHEVQGVFITDEKEFKLSRVLLEKWTKKKGADVEEMTGHETKYFIDDVPTSATDFKKFVSELLDESFAKTITNPLYFNSRLKWNERREILSAMAGEITNDQILDAIQENGNDNFDLIELLNAETTLENEKKKIAVKKRELKDKIEVIPARLDELNRMKPEEKDFDAIESEIVYKKNALKAIDDQIENQQKGVQDQQTKISEAQKKKFELENKVESIKQQQKIDFDSSLFADKSRLTQIEAEIKEINKEADAKKLQIEKNGFIINELNTLNAAMRADFAKVNASSFEMAEDSTCCPTCKRALENAAELEEELRANFNRDKLAKIEGIRAKGVKNNEEIESLLKESQYLASETDGLICRKENIQIEEKAIREKLNVKFEETITPEWESLLKQISEIQIPELKTVDVSELRDKKSEIEKEIESKNLELLSKYEIEKHDARKNELNEEKRVLSQELANLEKIEMQIDRFNKAKIELIEARVNSKFELVKFKMFETQLNGGESPACECLVDGVPFNDLNTASRINAGLDIINALQKHFEILAPVFIDGRESITDIIPTQCQIVSLIVDPTKEVLTVE
jgi:DNA repair exonuclease SbcCD ATPase subunit